MHFLIVGVGSIGERHLRNFLRIQDVRCSIAEVNAKTRDKIAAEYSVVAAYADYRDADLASFDGIVICVPANLHVPIAIDAVRAGTHVLSEKPLAMCLEGVDELKRLRDEQQRIVSVAFPLRTDPLHREMKERIDSRELGDVQVMNCYTGQYWPRMRRDYPPQYAQKRETGGGVIPDMLVHVVNFMEWVLGPPRAVSAGQWRLTLKDIATEDTGYVVLHFDDDRVSYLTICLSQRDTTSRLESIAAGGTYQLRHRPILESSRASVGGSGRGTGRRNRRRGVGRGCDWAGSRSAGLCVRTGIRKSG